MPAILKSALLLNFARDRARSLAYSSSSARLFDNYSICKNALLMTCPYWCGCFEARASSFFAVEANDNASDNLPVFILSWQRDSARVCAINRDGVASSISGISIFFGSSTGTGSGYGLNESFYFSKILRNLTNGENVAEYFLPIDGLYFSMLLNFSYCSTKLVCQSLSVWIELSV